jgi:hypothetical protein
MNDDAPMVNDMRSTAVQQQHTRRDRASLPHSLFATIIIGLAMVMTQGAGAQTTSPPQPAPRPRETLREPLTGRSASTPEQSTPPSPAPLSRQALRAQQRACAQEWSGRQKTGQTTGLLWIEFFETCRKQF